MKKIDIPGAMLPAGHYSHGIVSGGMVYVSGQLPVDPVTGERCKGDIEAQTARALENVRLVLEAAGSSMDKVVKVTVYTADVAYWSDVNEVYAEVFGNHQPARSVIPAPDLHYGSLVEIEAVAEL